MNKLIIPRLRDNAYLDKIDHHWLVYQPVSTRGLAILNREAKFLFDLIDGKRNLNEIWEEAKKKDNKVKIDEIEKIFEDFKKEEIIFFRRDRSDDLSHGEGRETLPYGEPTHLGIWLHLTNQCNLRCKYCYVCKTAEKMSWETAERAVRNIIRDAKKHNYKKITFKFSGGECLLEFETVLKLVKLARDLCRDRPPGGTTRRSSPTKNTTISTDFVILTNGVLLTEEIAKKLRAEKIRAAVSLDGLNKFNNNRIFPSGKSSFKFVIAGIENLLKHKVPFNVSTTVTAQNVSNLPELTKYFLKKNIPFAFNFYRENPLVKEKLINEDQKLIKYLKRSYEIIGKNPPKYSLINGLLDRITFNKPHIHTCGVGQSYIVVRHDGTLHSCQMTLEDKAIGTIDDPDLIETMRKGSLIKLKEVREKGVMAKKPCNACQWRFVCCGGCPLLSQEQKESAAVNSPYCAVYKALIPVVLKCEAKRLIKR